MVTLADSLKENQRKAFYERHRSIAVAMALVVFLLPFVGLYVTGLFGAVVGFLLSIAAYFLTPYVVSILREGYRER
ncbi:MAG TPA: hypothetical protein VFG71_04585 [Nitrospiraceae bacterium]|nr:hypothetical protein [Nitrospiraceae bacterium]